MMFRPDGLPYAVLSDMDGLLLDTERLSLKSFYAVAEGYGLDKAAADAIFPELIGRNKAAHQEVFKLMLPSSIDRQAFAETWMAAYLALLEGAVPLKDGAAEFMAAMQEHDVPFYVVTSSATAKAETLLARAGLRGYVAHVVGGDQVAQGKPAPDIYLKAAGLAEAKIKTPMVKTSIRGMLALEDSDNGTRAAVASGAVVVQIPDLAPPSPEVRALGHIILPHLRGLSEHFGWPFKRPLI